MIPDPSEAPCLDHGAHLHIPGPVVAPALRPADPSTGVVDPILRRHAINTDLARRVRQGGCDNYAHDLETCKVTEGLWICTGCGRPSYHPRSCRHRLCAFCGPERSRARARTARVVVRRMSQPKLLTLTMRRAKNLDTGLSDVRAAFSRWRRLKAIKTRLQGGIYAIEAKPKVDGWHVHIHAIIDCDFIPKQTIYRTWAKAVRQPTASIDISRVNADQAANEVAKYTAKGADVKRWTPEQLSEWVVATRNVRLFQTFGIWHSVALSALLDDPPPPPRPCPHCAKVDRMIPIRAGPRIYGKAWSEILATCYRHLPRTKTVGT